MADSILKRVVHILSNNADKDFVQRILAKDDYPVLKNEDGSVSTHSMATAEVDGKHIVYPTVDWDDAGESLQRYEDRHAVERALNKGNFIEFNNARDALWFSKNYKSVWKNRNKEGANGTK